jgi:hypothetical protein
MVVYAILMILLLFNYNSTMHTYMTICILICADMLAASMTYNRRRARERAAIKLREERDQVTTRILR